MDLTGKNVVFVAGFGGIGFEACKQLMNRNVANLFLLDIMENPTGLQQLQDLNKNTKVTYLKCDVTDKNCIKNVINQVVESVQYIDVLVNGAGVVAERNVEFAVNVNLIGLINTTLEAMPYMDKSQKGRGGVILNIASVLGLEPWGGISVYSATKFGVVGFTRSMADPFYYNRSGVAFTGLCPGLTITPMTTNPDMSPTLEDAKPLIDKLCTAEWQPAAKAGEHVVQVLEMAQNDSLWISDRGALSKVEYKVYWES
ncbi:alcohol dehydrogenase-like [Musca autumnalis]|uniref:alcohol dehydrogenase-like n=1 Tax=Musca autumnalis TaxID=221902 RepID=UPI003CF32A41